MNERLSETKACNLKQVFSRRSNDIFKNKITENVCQRNQGIPSHLFSWSHREQNGYIDTESK